MSTVKNIITTALVALMLAGCSKSTDDLIEDMYSDNRSVREFAVSRLVRKQGDHETVEKLIPLLHGDNELVAYMTIPLLGSLADTSAVAPLGDVLLHHEDSEFRYRAAWSLGTIGNDSALPYLVEALDDPDSDVRSRAVQSLGYLYDIRALPPIYATFRDEVDSVRAYAIQSHYYFRTNQKADVYAADLAGMANDPSERVRYVAAQALGGGYPDSTVAGALLVDALEDDSKSVRLEAIKSLKKIKFAAAVPILKDMYDIASVDEEVEISGAIKEISGEDYPPPDSGL